jgi:hypothetical protein
MATFTESSTTQAAVVDRLTQADLGWTFVAADELVRDKTEVLIETHVVEALQRLNPILAERPELVNEVQIRDPQGVQEVRTRADRRTVRPRLRLRRRALLTARRRWARPHRLAVREWPIRAELRLRGRRERTARRGRARPWRREPKPRAHSLLQEARPQGRQGARRVGGRSSSTASTSSGRCTTDPDLQGRPIKTPFAVFSYTVSEAVFYHDPRGKTTSNEAGRVIAPTSSEPNWRIDR